VRVLYVYDGDWPKGATRVRKQTAALAEAGCEVRLVCRNESRDPRIDTESWMEIRRLPQFRGRLNHLLNFPLFFSPVWVAAIRSSLRDFDPQVVIVEDLPLAPAVIALGRLFGRPVLYDMGEVYPEFLRGLAEQTRQTAVNRVLRNPRIAGFLERLVLRTADYVTVVSEESRDRALERGADAQRLAVVGNTPEHPEALRAESPRPDTLSDLGEQPVVLFVGILIHDRGLQTLVQAFPEVLQAVPEAVLVIVGDGPERPGLERLTTSLGISEHVVFTGWEDHSRLGAYYRSARVGMLPFLPIGQINFTLANKLFDYLSAGLPVVATDVPPMRRVISEGDVGLLVPGRDPSELAAAIVRILDLDPGEWDRMSERACRLVDERYSWQYDARRMVDAVRSLADQAVER